MRKYLSSEEQVQFLNELKKKLKSQMKKHHPDRPETQPQADKKDDVEESYRDVFDVDGKVVKVSFPVTPIL